MLGHGHSNEVEKTRVDGQNPKQPPMKYELILNNHLLIKEIDFFYAILEDVPCFNEVGIHLGTSDHSVC